MSVKVEVDLCVHKKNEFQLSLLSVRFCIFFSPYFKVAQGVLLSQGFQVSDCSKYKAKFDFLSENLYHQSIHSGQIIPE